MKKFLALITLIYIASLTIAEVNGQQGADGGNENVQVQGSLYIYGPDGVMRTVSYTADENGFQPVGDHLPKA
ncbi:Cuticle protein CP14.6 [Orchesella cincta]|uniref:Cuticle protein CP14.6 n=1 Tax=Orchesella cincta TaxID=48709 RepID=A0A1D2MBZ6_ORCCI|nr:Cuticle protein CP14.6 [Orchesella cincta]